MNSLTNDQITKPNSNFSQESHKIESPSLNLPNDNLLTYWFPGSDRYYAKRPDLIKPEDKSYGIKPDTSVKYYLMIKRRSGNYICAERWQ